MISAEINVAVVCASESVNSWWNRFFSGTAKISIYWPVVDDELSSTKVIDALRLSGKLDAIFILSEHVSLKRDSKVVDMLRSEGLKVVGAGVQESIFELDKLRAKRHFDKWGILTPKWSTKPMTDAKQLLKDQQGTASNEVCWAMGQNWIAKKKIPFILRSL